MKFLSTIITLLIFSTSGLAQKKLDRALKTFNIESVPYAYVKNLNTTKDIVFLDSRKKAEFDVSHLKDAIWVGYKTYEQKMVNEKIPNKDTPIIVYCSIGVRSENIGEKLQKAGYTNVKNLYGGIFEWKNQDKKVFNNKATETDSVHAFNKHWGKLLHKGVKVYDE